MSTRAPGPAEREMARHNGRATPGGGAGLRIPGLVITEHEFSVPLDHARPDGERIAVFAREVADPDGLDRPLLVFFQGGPGFEAPRPTAQPAVAGLARARADGLPRAAARPARHGALDAGRRALPGLDAARAGRLPHALPRRLDRPRRRADPRTSWASIAWSVLGQSFGGFCVDELPLARARGPARGLHHRRPRADRPAHRRRSTRATYRRTLDRSRRYYERYPGDRDRVRELCARLESRRESGFPTATA